MPAPPVAAGTRSSPLDLQAASSTHIGKRRHKPYCATSKHMGMSKLLEASISMAACVPKYTPACSWAAVPVHRGSGNSLHTSEACSQGDGVAIDPYESRHICASWLVCRHAGHHILRAAVAAQQHLHAPLLLRGEDMHSCRRGSRIICS